MHEAKMHDESCFLTLTYSEDKVPENGTLRVDDCQRFLKRLRKSLSPKKIRFFLCGEYGEKKHRPHYHAIIFGYDFPDKLPLSLLHDSGKMGANVQYYHSESADALWGNGRVVIGAVSFDSACYVANYATKKINGKDAAKHYNGRKPEFLLMSRRPGIGRSFIERFMSDVYPSDSVIVRGIEARPPRYYDQILEAHNPALLESLKTKREAQAEKLEAMVLKSGEVVHVAPSRNARRLAVRKRVAEAKRKLKTRNLGE